MTLDYDDPSLDRLLSEHARRSRAGFTPPGLDGMLSAALDSGRPHRRWVWPLLAAVVLLAIPLITVLLVRHDPADNQPAQPAPSPSPSATSVLGGPVPWQEPVWTGHAIWLVAQVPPSRYCSGVPSIHAILTEVGSTSVGIVANLSINPDRAAMSELQKGICRNPGPDNGPGVGVSSFVDLPEPLAGRSIVDGTTHHAYRALDASAIPSIPGLPPAYHSFAYSGTPEENIVEHAWVADDLREDITLSRAPVDSPSASSWFREGKPSTIGLVNGHPTRVGSGRHSIVWKKDNHIYQVSESSVSGNHYRFSLAQLLELARSVP